MARNEELNAKFDKLESGKKLKRLVNRFIERKDLIVSTINNEIRINGEFDEDLESAFTADELIEVGTLLDSLIAVMDATSGIEEINENIS